MTWLAVAAAGAVGAACRYVVDFTVSARTGGLFPWGTLVVNLTGALLVGVVGGAATRFGLPGDVRLVAAAGFCGAYTTFSTLVYETWRLIEEGAYAGAAANLSSLVLSLPAVAAGWAMAGLLG